MLLLLPLEMALLMAMCVVVSLVSRDQVGQIPRRSQSDIACLCCWLGEDGINEARIPWVERCLL